jgi:hypothetical protein
MQNPPQTCKDCLAHLLAWSSRTCLWQQQLAQFDISPLHHFTLPLTTRWASPLSPDGRDRGSKPAAQAQASACWTCFQRRCR